MKEFDISKELAFYPKYELGRLCWFKTGGRFAYCGHYAGFYCDDFETMHIKYIVDCNNSTWSVDEIFETEEDANN